LGATLRVIAAASLGLCLARAAWALPKFAQKEDKPCSYCHVKPSGGGKRNPAGAWYEAHGFSLKGYTPPKPAPKKQPDNKKGKKK
jgi:hypothetical protein